MTIFNGRDIGHDELRRRNRYSRRGIVQLGLGAAIGLAATSILAACGDDDSADAGDGVGADDTDDGGASDELQDAMEQAEEETDFELDALDDDAGERDFPDDFPDDVPLPDDSEIITDMSSQRDDEREIYIEFVSDEDRMGMIETYASELEANYSVDVEYINEDLETAQWDFNGNGWEWARVQILDPIEDDGGEFQVLVILRDYEP